MTQEDIDVFARLCGDDQWIHVDAERATKESPFGTTVAHGNLTLSLIDGLRRDLIASKGFKLGVNYGWNRVRFPAPVPVGANIRMKATIAEVEEVRGGYQIAVDQVVEVEGATKPSVVSRGIYRFYA